MAQLVGLRKKMMATSTGSVTNGGCWYDCAASQCLPLAPCGLHQEGEAQEIPAEPSGDV